MAHSSEFTPAVMSDYDGTIALTDEFPIGGVDVSEAYALAIDAQPQLGNDLAEQFREQGGHNSRTPIEIVQDLRPDLSHVQHEDLARAITQGKLDILTGQIGYMSENGHSWPGLTEGFRDFWQELTHERERRKVGSAIISSGHKDFILRSFYIHGIEPPDVVVSMEAIESLALRTETKKIVKPAPLPLELAKTGLRAVHGGDIAPIYYVGDSPEKDGRLASNANVDFTLVDPRNAEKAWRELGRKMKLPVYSEEAA